MSCRSTSGGAVSTALARMVTGLPDRDIQKIFHALKREGADVAPPTTYDLSAWATRQQDLLDRAKRMSDTKRDGLRDRLFRARSEPTPDGSTFYAWSRVEARARQEVAIRSIPEAIDLEPAGSQRHLYELDAEGKPAKVWYASYGSNLHRDRFLTYIKGGSPEGSTRYYAGCRDTTEPEEDIAIRVAGARPHFALTSRVWHGGIAFIDAAKGETATGLGRAYAVSRDQFEDVVAQENGFRAGQCADIDYGEVLETGRLVTGTGPYETLLHIGDHDGAPVLTFTAPFSTRDALGRDGQVNSSGTRMPVRTNRPSAAYLRMIGSGLAETFGMDEVAQADYLRGCPGGDRYERKEVVQILRTPNPPPVPAWSQSKSYASSAYRSNSGYRRSPSGSTESSEPGSYGAGSYGSGSYEARSGSYGTGTGSGSGGPGSSGTGSSGGNDDSATGYYARKVAELAESPPPATDPSERGRYAAVKTYASGREQEDGLYGWKQSLTRQRAALKSQKESLAFAERIGRTGDTYYQYLWAQIEDNEQNIAELTIKVAHAKSQTPTTYYGPDHRTKSTGWWRAERSFAAGDLSNAEHKLAQYTADRDYFDNPTQPIQEVYRKKQRSNAQRQVTLYQRQVEALTSQLAEADALLIERGETLPPSSTA